MKRFTEEHEWVHVENGVATIGITAYAANELGDITFIELPETGGVIAQGDVLAVVESVKAASDVFSPVSGTVSEVNVKLEDTPELVNASAEQDGWIARLTDIRESDLQRLMVEEEYEDFVTP